ncbi:MAG: Holliday junction resolvase RuvX [Arcanobacterium sp.]|nr:Holliday junction resolvase RuvX [Arcanobacterium sp.]
MRKGVRIGVDVGQVRVGIAKSDSDGLMATPVGTFYREKNDFSAVFRLVKQLSVIEIIVGLPKNMDGSEGKSAIMARRWARKISRKLPEISVRLIDERLTSVSAHRLLQEAGRKEIDHRDIVDQVAAVLILEQALELEKKTGEIPGYKVDNEN